MKHQISFLTLGLLFCLPNTIFVLASSASSGVQQQPQGWISWFFSPLTNCLNKNKNKHRPKLVLIPAKKPFKEEKEEKSKGSGKQASLKSTTDYKHISSSEESKSRPSLSIVASKRMNCNYLFDPLPIEKNIASEFWTDPQVPDLILACMTRYLFNHHLNPELDSSTLSTIIRSDETSQSQFNSNAIFYHFGQIVRHLSGGTARLYFASAWQELDPDFAAEAWRDTCACGYRLLSLDENEGLIPFGALPASSNIFSASLLKEARKDDVKKRAKPSWFSRKSKNGEAKDNLIANAEWAIQSRQVTDEDWQAWNLDGELFDTKEESSENTSGDIYQVILNAPDTKGVIDIRMKNEGDMKLTPANPTTTAIYLGTINMWPKEDRKESKNGQKNFGECKHSTCSVTAQACDQDFIPLNSQPVTHLKSNRVCRAGQIGTLVIFPVNTSQLMCEHERTISEKKDESERNCCFSSRRRSNRKKEQKTEETKPRLFERQASCDNKIPENPVTRWSYVQKVIEGTLYSDCVSSDKEDKKKTSEKKGSYDKLEDKYGSKSTVISSDLMSIKRPLSKGQLKKSFGLSKAGSLSSAPIGIDDIPCAFDQALVSIIKKALQYRHDHGVFVDEEVEKKKQKERERNEKENKKRQEREEKEEEKKNRTREEEKNLARQREEERIKAIKERMQLEADAIAKKEEEEKKKRDDENKRRWKASEEKKKKRQLSSDRRIAIKSSKSEEKEPQEAKIEEKTEEKEFTETETEAVEDQVEPEESTDEADSVAEDNQETKTSHQIVERSSSDGDDDNDDDKKEFEKKKEQSSKSDEIKQAPPKPVSSPKKEPENNNKDRDFRVLERKPRDEKFPVTPGEKPMRKRPVKQREGKTQSRKKNEKKRNMKKPVADASTSTSTTSASVTEDSLIKKIKDHQLATFDKKNDDQSITLAEKNLNRLLDELNQFTDLEDASSSKKSKALVDEIIKTMIEIGKESNDYTEGLESLLLQYQKQDQDDQKDKTSSKKSRRFIKEPKRGKRDGSDYVQIISTLEDMYNHPMEIVNLYEPISQQQHSTPRSFLLNSNEENSLSAANTGAGKRIIRHGLVNVFTAAMDCPYLNLLDEDPFNFIAVANETHSNMVNEEKERAQKRIFAPSLTKDKVFTTYDKKKQKKTNDLLQKQDGSSSNNFLHMKNEEV